MRANMSRHACMNGKNQHLEVAVLGEGLDALQLGGSCNAVDCGLATAAGRRRKRQDLVFDAVKTRLGHLVALAVNHTKHVEHLTVISGLDGGRQDV